MRHAAGTMPSPPRCPNCDTEAPAAFCPACGQRQLGRLTFRSLAGELASRLFSVERGKWRTLLVMTAHPGRATRDYLQGRRTRYVSPVLWYVLCAGAQLLGVWLVRDRMTAVVTDPMPAQYFAWLEQQGVAEPRRWAADRYIALIQNAYTWLGLLTFVPLMAAIVRLAMWTRINFAECLVVALHVVGHVMLLTAVTGQVLVRIDPMLHGYVSYGIYVVYSVLTLGGAFGWSVRSVLAGLLSVSIAGIVFMLSIAFLTGYVLTHWIP
jgi:hypothetical protein